MVIYDLGNIADWLSAIGTISAVIVALYLARKDNKPRAKVKANIGQMIGVHGADSNPSFISLEIVNTGKIPIHLSECTFQLSKFSKKKMAFLDGSHQVNKLLNPGEYYEHQISYVHILNHLNSNNISELNTVMYYRDSLNNKYKTNVVLRKY